MDARIQDLPFDPATLHRLSPGLITSHHQNNYGGAVKRLNATRAQLSSTAFATAPGFQLNGLKREELIATNSMLLHELYFGSLERWREEFVAMGKALGGGSGWVLLDVRRAGVFENAATMLPGARWRDPTAAPPRCDCAQPASTHATCAVASMAGKPQAGPRRPEEHRHEVDHP